MSQIFFSYRRADSLKDARRIYDRLGEAFGRDNIFINIGNFWVRSDFPTVLREAVARCSVMLVIIGPSWLTIADNAGRRRLDDPDDCVRMEVRSALERPDCTVIPVLVDGAAMPCADDLPDDLRPLATRNATSVRDDPDFHRDVSKLIASIRPYLKPDPVTPDPSRLGYDPDDLARHDEDR